MVNLIKEKAAGKSEIQQALVGIGIYLALLISVLALLGLWVVAVLYWIMPLSIDGGPGIGLLRVLLAITGGVIIVASYIIGLMVVFE